MPQYAMGMADGPIPSSAREVPMARPVTATPASGMDPSYERELARQKASTRRAIVLGVLTALLLGTLVGAALGLAPKRLPVLAALPVSGFIVATVMTSSQRSSARSTARPSTSPHVSRRTADRAPDARPAVADAQTDEEWENWNAWDDDDKSWEAVPTTLPTYVNAPRASAVPRGIDRATPGEWTGSAMVETAQAMRSRPASEPLSSSVDHRADTAEIPVVTDEYESRRVVNE